MIHTVCVSSSRWSNQFGRLFFLVPRFPRESNFRLLQFQRMDSFGSSSNSPVLSVAEFDGSSSRGNEGYPHDSDRYSDVIVGNIPLTLNCAEHYQNSSDHKGDNFQLEVQNRLPANLSPSYHEEESHPLCKRRNKSNKMLKNISGRCRTSNKSSLQIESFPIFDSSCQPDESSLPNRFGKKKERPNFKNSCIKSSLVIENSPPFQPFNICGFERKDRAKSKYLWRAKDNDPFKRTEHVAEGTDNRILRPGMVLLKHYITLQEQINIVKICQKLGVGPGGFYRPGYKNGAKLRLQMMCLGLDWDPRTRKYGGTRAIDNNKPPDIPHEFAMLVKKTLEDAHALIKNQSTMSNVEDILPSMSPNICIANFYTTSGKLGLHQDRDESKQSLFRGLPVVSFSVGDSAEFLYGDDRDTDKAEKVVLESGDVLIFGGESRHIFHGVSSIVPNSAPKILLKYTALLPGRLNLTFREY